MLSNILGKVSQEFAADIKVVHIPPEHCYGLVSSLQSSVSVTDWRSMVNKTSEHHKLFSKLIQMTLDHCLRYGSF